MKKKAIIILIFIGIIVVGWQIISNNIVKQANQITASDVDLSHIEDGAYIGEYILSPVKVMVEVIIRDN